VTRIIAGAAKGRRLAVPPGDGTRPTSDRAREALFSALDSELGGFEGLAVLDLFAGSGALGLEALSRGAVRVVLVEADRRAAGIIRRNVAVVDQGTPDVRVVTDRAERYVEGEPPGPFDVVLLDPPYAVGDADVTKILSGLATGGWLADEASVVLERSSRDADFAWPGGYEPTRSRSYGEARLHYAVWYVRARSTTGPSEPE
jgi:16S rRNA (guanine966-N2)-methyltransferase